MLNYYTLMQECRRLEEVLERIEKAKERAGRRDEVLLLGATKTVPPSKILKFYECGLKLFGENRVQEFLKKYEELKDLKIEWHFIGRLQSNKVKYLVGKVSLIHSLDRESLLKELQKRAKEPWNTLIEVNLAKEETKGGIFEEEVKIFFEKVLNYDKVKVLGLMTIPPYSPNPQDSRKYFKRLRELKEALEEEFKVRLPHLSMGMSSDFEVAVEEGATIVRIGTLLFGERKT